MAPRLELNTAGKWQIAIVDHHRKRRQPAAKRATAATNYRTQLLGERIYRSFVLRVKLFLYLFMPSRTTALAWMPKITLVQITDFVIFNKIRFVSALPWVYLKKMPPFYVAVLPLDGW